MSLLAFFTGPVRIVANGMVATGHVTNVDQESDYDYMRRASTYRFCITCYTIEQTTYAECDRLAHPPMDCIGDNSNKVVELERKVRDLESRSQDLSAQVKLLEVQNHQLKQLLDAPKRLATRSEAFPVGPTRFRLLEVE